MVNVAGIGAPIVYRDAPWGELFVSRSHGRDAFTDADLALAQQIAFGAIRAEARG